MIGYESRSGVWPNVLNQFILDHADRRGSTTGQAFDEFDAVFSIFADRDGSVHPVVVV